MFDFGFALEAATTAGAGLGGIGGGAYLISLAKSKKDSAKKAVKGIDRTTIAPNVSSSKLEEIRTKSVEALSQKAKEWEDLWRAHRDFLKSVSGGESNLATSTQLDKIVDLLRLRRPVLPGHEPVSNHGSHQGYMDLTHVIYYDKVEKVWYRAPSASPGEDNFSLRKEIDEGLLEISELLLRVPKTEAELHDAAKQFAQNYAAHLLLNYRSTPSTRKSSATGPDQGSKRKQRQNQLDSTMNDLIFDLREYVQENPDAVIEDVHVEAFQEIRSLIEKESLAEVAKSEQEEDEKPLPEVGAGLDLSVLNEDEEEVVDRLRKNFELFDPEEVKAVEKFLQKVVISAEVIQDGGEQFVAEMRERGLALAEENRRFAFTGMSKIVDARVLDRGIQLLHNLRVDNRYLADQVLPDGEAITA